MRTYKSRCHSVHVSGVTEGGGFLLVVEDHKKPALNRVKRHINKASGSITGDTRKKDPLYSRLYGKTADNCNNSYFYQGRAAQFCNMVAFCERIGSHRINNPKKRPIRTFGEGKIYVPGWSRTTNLSVNSRTRYPIAPRKHL